MKTHLRDLGTLLVLLISLPSFGQQLVKFDYDDAGNRIKRYEAVLSREAATEDTTSIDQAIVYHESLFPNPTQGELRFLSDNSELGTSEVQIVDLEGRIIFSDTFESPEFEVDLSWASNGIYLVRWVLHEEIKTFKVVKQ